MSYSPGSFLFLHTNMISWKWSEGQNLGNSWYLSRKWSIILPRADCSVRVWRCHRTDGRTPEWPPQNDLRPCSLILRRTYALFGRCDTPKIHSYLTQTGQSAAGKKRRTKSAGATPAGSRNASPDPSSWRCGQEKKESTPRWGKIPGTVACNF